MLCHTILYLFAPESPFQIRVSLAAHKQLCPGHKTQGSSLVLRGAAGPTQEPVSGRQSGLHLTNLETWPDLELAVNTLRSDEPHRQRVENPHLPLHTGVGTHGPSHPDETSGIQDPDSIFSVPGQQSRMYLTTTTQESTSQSQRTKILLKSKGAGVQPSS